MSISSIKKQYLDLTESYDYDETALVGLLLPIIILILLIGWIVALPFYLLGRFFIWIARKYEQD